MGTLTRSLAPCPWFALLIAAFHGDREERNYSYDQSWAIQNAYMATAAYCGYPGVPNDTALEEWRCGPACDNVPNMSHVRVVRSVKKIDAYAYVGVQDGRCVLAFRGTSNVAGWITDLKSARMVDLNAVGVLCQFEGRPCMVGDGFIDNYVSIAQYIQGNLSEIGCDQGALWSRGLTVTGHSLGAAEAVIAMYDLKTKGYKILDAVTIGQPRVGDITFARAFEAAFGSLAIPFRVTHAQDPVVHLPPEVMGFRHIGTEVFYDGNVSQGYKVCTAPGEVPLPEDPACADRYWNLPEMVYNCVRDHRIHCDHLTYYQDVMAVRIDGATCLGHRRTYHDEVGFTAGPTPSHVLV